MGVEIKAKASDSDEWVDLTHAIKSVELTPYEPEYTISWGGEPPSYDYIPTIPSGEIHWIAPSYMHYFRTKDGNTIAVPVLSDGTVKIELAALVELFEAAGIINGDA